MPGSVFGSYPTTTTGRDYSYYGGAVKRARTSMDYGSRNIYDIDGRMVRQMDAYSQATAMYPSQLYQTTSMIQPYATTPTPRPTSLTTDYTFRQPPQLGSTTTAAPAYTTTQDTKIPPSWNWVDFSRSTR